ncbi:MAG: hypothetical protein HQK58_12200 [Deltaproteobacteria bacterium]|nr:hypothetical protein [Deltaproteobacteria bacterium]MBF0497315.1 hypothetical protein [Deltaproteobacteria bacterium]
MDKFMDQSEQYRIRIENCVKTIIDIHRFLCSENINQNILVQFERLENVFNMLDTAQLSEVDMEKIEESTNNLLKELCVLFEHHGLQNIYDETKH